MQHIRKLHLPNNIFKLFPMHSNPPAWRLVPFYLILYCFDARHCIGFIKWSLCHVKMPIIGLGWYQLANPQCVCIKSDNCFSQTIYIQMASKHVPVSSHDWFVVVLVSLALLDIRMRMVGICCKGNKLINTGLQEEFQNYSREFHQHSLRWKSLYLVRKKQRICLCTSL